MTWSDFEIGDAAIVATIIAVAGLFLLSPVTLEARGIAYLTSGGGIFSKFHPSTFAAVLAIGLRGLATRRPLSFASRLLTRDRGVLLLLVAVAIAGVYAVVITKTPVTPIIDTFVLPCLVFVLLRELDPAILRILAIVISIIFCVNAVMAIIEFLTHTHFVSIEVPEGTSSDPRRSDVIFDWRAQLALDWRATALMGHPLSNGLLVGAFILCLSAPGSNWIPGALKLVLIPLQFVSMFSFGARTALGLTVLFGIWLGFGQAIDAVSRGRRLRPRHLALAFLGVALVIAVAAILIQSGFADRTIDRFSEDGGSAATRITMFNLFEPLPLFDMLFAPNKDVVATWQHLEGLEFGIESSWVGLALIYGMVVTSILMIGTLAFAVSVARSSGRGAGLILLLYFILVSVSATMSGKTTTLAAIVCLIMVFLHRDERPFPFRLPRFARAA